MSNSVKPQIMDMPEFRVRRLLALEKADADRQVYVKPITDYCTRQGHRVFAVHSIGDMHIVEYAYRDGETRFFRPWVNDGTTMNVAPTLDQAVLIALCEKYGSDSDTLPFYMARMIGMPVGK